MDSLTHLLVGHAMGVAANSVTAHPFGTAVYWAVLIGNSLPDIDVPVSLLLGRGIKLHRTLTHTIPGAALLSLVTAVGITRIIPGTPLGLAFLWTLLGCLVHMGLDCLNLFGARPLWPLNGRSIDLGVLHIVDPVLLALLGVSTLAVSAGMAGYPMLTLAFLLIFPYVTYRIAIARRLYRTLRAQGSLRARVIPWYATWKYVFETEGAIEFGHWDRRGRKVVKTYRKLDTPLIRATMADPSVAAFLRAAEYPYATVEEDERGLCVTWGDALRQMRADFRPVRVRVQG
jgi:inner membrane protein